MRIVGIFVLLMSLTANADFKGFVKTEGGRNIYAQHISAGKGQPTVALLNGLTYSTENWSKVLASLNGRGLDILLLDFAGQGKTLEQAGPATDIFLYSEQTRDLVDVMNFLKIDRVHAVGLSYGGAIAMDLAANFPDRVDQIILMAPYTEPQETQDTWIKMQIQGFRLMFPFSGFSDDYLYDLYLRNMVYSTYPSAEPVILQHPYRLEAAYRLAQGVRRFFAKDIAHVLPAKRAHLIVAENDQYIRNVVHDRFWQAVPEANRGIRIDVRGSEHKISDVFPHFTSQIVQLLISPTRTLQPGLTYQADPLSGKIYLRKKKVADLEKEEKK